MSHPSIRQMFQKQLRALCPPRMSNGSARQPESPAVDARSLDEETSFAGGYIVAHYGSQNPQGIDAIQLEFGVGQRASPRLAPDVADALIAFLEAQGLLPK